MPIDYRADVKSPMMRALQGFQVAQQMTINQQRIDAANKAMARQQELQGALAQFAERQGKTIDDYRNFMIRYPEMSQQVDANLQGLTEEQRQGKINRLMPVYAALKSGNYEIADGLIDEQMRAARSSQDPQEEQNLKIVKENLAMDPKGALTSARIFLYNAMGEDKFAKMDEQLYEAESAGVEKDKLHMSEFLPDKTMVGVTKQGEMVVMDSSGKRLYGDDAKSKIEEALQYGIDLRAEAAKAEAEARQSVAQVGEYNKLIDNLNQEISTLDEARVILDEALAEDKFAGVGPIAQFIPAVTDTAQSMRNVARRLGLKVISANTFGALSEYELKVAMDTGFPKGMRGPALKKWLIDRVEAKRKLMREIEKAAAFMEGGGTVGEWIKRQAEVRKMRKEGTLPEEYDMSPVEAPKTAPKVKRTGTFKGRKVIEYDDGTIEYAN